MKSFRDKLRAGPCLIGTIIGSESITLAESTVFTGLDWVFFDLEHSANSLDTVQRQIQSINGRIFTCIRIESPEPVYVKRALDTGCDAIIVPQVNSAELARAIVDAGKYAPIGNRSVGISRAQNYGANFAEYLANGNDKTSIIIQIENIKAVDCISDLVKVPGIDGLFIGPLDLSSSMGLIGQINHPDVLIAIDKVKIAAASAQLPIGLFVPNNEAAKNASNKFQFLLVGTDIGRFMQSIKDTVSALRA